MGEGLDGGGVRGYEVTTRLLNSDLCEITEAFTTHTYKHILENFLPFFFTQHFKLCHAKVK